jgi:putative hydrolase of the HAD superfamily
MKYKHLFIDLDDTLWNTSLNSKITMKDVYVDYDFDRYYDSFDSYYEVYWENNCHLWGLYRKGLISRRTLITERILHPLRPFGIIDEYYAMKISDDFLERTTQKKNLIPYAMDVLEYLQGKYKLYILSNGFEEVQYKKMQNSGLSPFFTHVILSDDIGINKPNPEIFEYALKKAQADCAESLMIGDSMEADIVGAANYGLDQIWFNPEKESAGEITPTYTISSLLEIKDIL